MSDEQLRAAAEREVYQWDNHDNYRHIVGEDPSEPVVVSLARAYLASHADQPEPSASGGGLIYLASPYSHEDTAIRDERFNIVCRVAARLMAQGHLIFSPIAHTHPIAMAGELPTGWDFWQRYDHAHLDAAAQVWVLRIDGWDRSTGVKAEIEYAMSKGKPVAYIFPVPSDFHPAPAPEVAELRAEVERLRRENQRLENLNDQQSEAICDLHESHSGLARGIKAAMGLQFWPELKGELRIEAPRMLKEFVANLTTRAETAEREREALREELESAVRMCSQYRDQIDRLT